MPKSTNKQYSSKLNEFEALQINLDEALKKWKDTEASNAKLIDQNYKLQKENHNLLSEKLSLAESQMALNEKINILTALQYEQSVKLPNQSINLGKSESDEIQK